jgi:phosphoglycerol transferase MdoB-like AlkP superfamily enzyme
MKICLLDRIRYYLSVAFQDTWFRIFFVLLVTKTVLFCVVTRLGLDSFVSTLGALLVLLPVSLLFDGNKIKILYLLLIDIILSVLYFSQSVYFKYFEDFLSFYNISEINQVTDVYGSVARLVGLEVLFLFDIVLIPVFIVKKYKLIPCVFKEKFATYLLLFSTGVFCNLDYVAHRNFANNYISRYVYAYNFGILTYQVHDILSFFSRKYYKQEITDSELGFVSNQLAGRSTYGGGNQFTGIGKGRNLILIQVESLQNFVVARKYRGREITPNLNALLKHGVQYRNVYDQTAAGNSADATFLAHCSLYPASRGTVAFLHAHNNFDSLTRLLEENGYATMVLHAYYRTFWNFETLDRSIGFRYQGYQEEYKRDEVLGWGVSDRSFFAQSVGKMKELPLPFYVHMRTLTTHDPFAAVTPAIDAFPVDGLENRIIGRYMRSMHYVDAAIGDFLQRLSDAGMLASTVIVVYGDHRARLPEEELRQVGVRDTDESRKVPVIVSSSAWDTPSAVDTIGGLIDLAPTICNILGIDTSGKVFLGHDMGRKSVGYVVFRDGSHISPDGRVDRQFALNELRTSDLLVENDAIPEVKKYSSHSGKRGASKLLPVSVSVH